MDFGLKVIFGKDQVNKYLNKIPLTDEEEEINQKEFSFTSEVELLAFKKGIEAATGWTESFIIE